MAEVAEPAHLVAWQITVNYFIAIVGLAVSAHFFNVEDQGYRVHCVESCSRQVDRVESQNARAPSLRVRLRIMYLCMCAFMGVRVCV